MRTPIRPPAPGKSPCVSAQKLQHLRLKKGWSQEELASEAGIPWYRYRKFELAPTEEAFKNLLFGRLNVRKADHPMPGERSDGQKLALCFGMTWLDLKMELGLPLADQEGPVVEYPAEEDIVEGWGLKTGSNCREVPTGASLPILGTVAIPYWIRGERLLAEQHALGVLAPHVDMELNLGERGFVAAVWEEDGYVPEGFRHGELVCVSDQGETGAWEHDALYVVYYRYGVLLRRAWRLDDGRWKFVRIPQGQQAPHDIWGDTKSLRVLGRVTAYADEVAAFLQQARGEQVQVSPQERV